MKNLVKTRSVLFFGIIVLVAVIGFLMTACDSDGGSDGIATIVITNLTPNMEYTAGFGVEYSFTTWKEGITNAEGKLTVSFVDDEIWMLWNEDRYVYYNNYPLTPFQGGRSKEIFKVTKGTTITLNSLIDFD